VKHGAGSLQRTSTYASFLRVSGALHLGTFDQPKKNHFSNELLGIEHELGIHHKRDHWSGAACLSDVCAPQTREVLSRIEETNHTDRGKQGLGANCYSERQWKVVIARSDDDEAIP
jgi:hypothetical protein